MSLLVETFGAPGPHSLGSVSRASGVSLQSRIIFCRPDDVTRVHRHNSHTPIFVSQKMVAPTDSNEPKPARTNAVTTCFPVTRGALLMQQR